MSVHRMDELFPPSTVTQPMLLCVRYSSHPVSKRMRPLLFPSPPPFCPSPVACTSCTSPSFTGCGSSLTLPPLSAAAPDPPEALPSPPSFSLAVNAFSRPQTPPLVPTNDFFLTPTPPRSLL